MTRAQLRNLVRTRLNDNTNRWSDEDINLELDIAGQRVADYPFFALKRVWPFLEKTTTAALVPGQQYVTKPSDIKHILGIWIGSSFAECHNNNKIAYCSPKDFEERFYAYGTNGRPSVFTLFGDKIYFNSIPTAADTIFIKYGQRVSGMSSDSSTPLEDLMPEEYHYILVPGAVEQLKDSTGGADLNEARNAESKFNKALQVMAEALLTPELDRRGFVRDVDGYESDMVGLLN